VVKKTKKSYEEAGNGFFIRTFQFLHLLIIVTDMYYKNATRSVDRASMNLPLNISCKPWPRIHQRFFPYLYISLIDELLKKFVQNLIGWPASIRNQNIVPG